MVIDADCEPWPGDVPAPSLDVPQPPALPKPPPPGFRAPRSGCYCTPDADVCPTVEGWLLALHTSEAATCDPVGVTLCREQAPLFARPWRPVAASLPVPTGESLEAMLARVAERPPPATRTRIVYGGRLAPVAAPERYAAVDGLIPMGGDRAEAWEL